MTLIREEGPQDIIAIRTVNGHAYGVDIPRRNI